MKKIIILMLIFLTIGIVFALSPENKKDIVKSHIINQINEEKENLNNTTHSSDNIKGSKKIINSKGDTILNRFSTPENFQRVEVEPDSYGEYLRNFKLKVDGSKVMYFNGRKKLNNVYEAVLDIDIGERDLQQCADAVMRLWAEYNYKNGDYDEIHFNFTNGFRADYTKWRAGHYIRVNGNNVEWVQTSSEMDTYKSFRKYMDMVFAYAGTLSLSQEMKRVPFEEMQIGDIFLKGNDPGHCVLVVDMAENESTGEKIFMIAQSYMPAQDIHILKNYNDKDISPWYSMNFGQELKTPEWVFTKEQVYRFD